MCIQYGVENVSGSTSGMLVLRTGVTIKNATGHFTIVVFLLKLLMWSIR